MAALRRPCEYCRARAVPSRAAVPVPEPGSAAHLRGRRLARLEQQDGAPVVAGCQPLRGPVGTLRAAHTMRGFKRRRKCDQFYTWRDRRCNCPSRWRPMAAKFRPGRGSLLHTSCIDQPLRPPVRSSLCSIQRHDACTTLNRPTELTCSTDHMLTGAAAGAGYGSVPAVRAAPTVQPADRVSSVLHGAHVPYACFSAVTAD